MEFLVRFGELFLKGKNRSKFEKRLVNNIDIYLKKNNIKGKISKKRNRIILNIDKKPDLRKVFGIVSFNPCVSCKAEINDIKKVVLKTVKKIKLSKNKTFRITANKTDKSISMSSMDLNREIGSFVVEKTGAKVNLENYDFEIGIDIMDEIAYVFSETIPCFGGLPVGIEGTVLCLIEDKKSVLAALLTMKRGCKIICLMKKDVNIDLLEKYSYGFKLKKEKIKNISEVDVFAEKYRTSVIIVGQTLGDFKELKINTPIFKPLIVFDEKEIKEKLKLFAK